MRHTGGLLAAALSIVFSWSDGLEARFRIADNPGTILDGTQAAITKYVLQTVDIVPPSMT